MYFILSLLEVVCQLFIKRICDADMLSDWTGADEDQGDVNVWEDNWDDDNVEDDFSQQLRSVIQPVVCLALCLSQFSLRCCWLPNLGVKKFPQCFHLDPLGCFSGLF